MSTFIQKRDGFTLIEMLVVVIVLGILAMVIVSQVRVSTEDAKLNTLKANLNNLRGAIQLYHQQHDSVYPGANNSAGMPSANIGQANAAFLNQLTMYSRVTGNVSSVKTAVAKFGPYIKSDKLPTNPFNDMNTVTCDITTTDISVRTSDGTSGWKFYTKTGILMANDGEHDDL